MISLVSSKKSISLFFLVFLVLFSGIALAGDPPSWDSGFSFSTFYGTEDSQPSISYNFSQNITDPENSSLTFSIDTDSDKPIDSSIHGFSESVSFFTWIGINSSTGILNINSTADNETGRYNISIQATDDEDLGATTRIYFIVNATNDFPSFVGVQDSYNVTQDTNFFEYLNATDEESHYPLDFNLTFDSCSLANWSTRGNCTLFELNNYSDTAEFINFTPGRDDVGTYYLNLSVSDFGESASCTYDYCASDYSENKTTHYSQLISFDVYATLFANVSDCQNSVFQENETGSCIITIDSRGEDDTINASSLATLRNYDGNISNESWFYATQEFLAANFTKEINVSFFPEKTEVGNWTINFTVQDLNFSENFTDQIYVLVNRTFNDVPEIASISNKNFSTGLVQTINIEAYDDDMLIPDKNDSLGGYNETLSFSLGVFNQSDLSQEFNITGFDVEVTANPLEGTNKTTARIQFTPLSNETGDYTVYLNSTDKEGAIDTEIFNMSIFGNNAPSWSGATIAEIVIYEDNNTYLNFSQNVSDPDGDGLTFSFTNDTRFDDFLNNFSTSTGVANLSPQDVDVGQHIVNITVSDGFLSDSLVFNFTIYNVNDNLSIVTPLSIENGTGDSDSGMNLSEDNVTTITMFIDDDDFKIPSNQLGFYNETNVVNYTFEGPNSNLFNFSLDSKLPSVGRAIYEATFTPNKSDVGDYNVTLNLSDASDSSGALSFNLTVFEEQHLPVITNISNQTSLVNGTVFIDVNATDTEDINDSFGNLTFSYAFLTGDDFINSNESILNSTSGLFNITFNSSQAGRYHINLTVNDSTNLTDSTDFWLDVYDTPSVYSPSTSIVFNLVENATSNLPFTVNHSVGNNLTYNFYFLDSLRLNTSSYGNGSNVTWQFAPNYSDETYGEYRNITLTALSPIYGELLSVSQQFRVNITHANAPVNFSGNIGDKQGTYGTDITVNLSNYFSDVDYSDVNYNQTLNFTATSNKSSSDIDVSFDGFVATFSASAVAQETFNITGQDLNDSNSTLTSAFSNNFEISFTEPSATTTPSGGGSGSDTASFRFIMPEPINVRSGDIVNASFQVHNNGRRSISTIDLNGSFYQNNANVDDQFVYSLSSDQVSSLRRDQKANISVLVNVGASAPGSYILKVAGSSRSPLLTEYGDMVFIIENIELEEKLLFTEQRIAENPECIELMELIDEVEVLMNAGDFVAAESLLTRTLRACDDNIAQRALFSPPTFAPGEDERAFFYLAMFTIIAFGVGIIYYVYKEIILRRSIKSYLRKL